MRKIICICLIWISFIVIAEAKGISVNDVTLKMKSELNLSDEQTEKIRPIIKEALLKHQKLMQSLEAQVTISKSDLRMAMRKIRKEENTKLNQVLSEEQMRKLVAKQNIREGLNKDNIDFSEGLSGSTAMSPQGGSFQF